MGVLVRNVGWPGSNPVMTLVDDAITTLSLRGAALRFRSLDGPGVLWCTGRRDADSGRPVACPHAARATAGSRCAACVAADPYRFVHIVHRQDFLSRGLEAVVLQPHWLYVATFAGGVHKVGTAADPRKWGRLTEQGAVVGRYIARAVDGRVVRHLEDAMTDTAGLRQAVRAAAKASGLAAPVDLEALDRDNAEMAAIARRHLGDLQISGEFSGEDFAVVDERWAPPDGRAALLRGARAPYPLDVATGTHGLEIVDCVGSAAIATVRADPDTRYVVDLSRLSGRRVELGKFETELPAMQGALF